MSAYVLRLFGTREALIALAVVVLALLWNAGTFDKVLYHVDLNSEPCARNLITGAVFCGEELDEIERRRREAQRELRELGR